MLVPRRISVVACELVSVMNDVVIWVHLFACIPVSHAHRQTPNPGMLATASGWPPMWATARPEIAVIPGWVGYFVRKAVLRSVLVHTGGWAAGSGLVHT